MNRLDCAAGRLTWVDTAPDRSGGPTIMLLHSSAGSSRQWRRLAERLAPQWRVLMPDMIGYGATPMTGPSPTLADELALLTALADRIDGPFHLAGHSYGAAVALELACLMPERILSLAVYEPVAFALLCQAGRQEAWQEIAALARRHIDLVDEGDLAGAAAAFLDYWIGPGALAMLRPEMQQYVAASMAKVAAEWRDLFQLQLPAGHYAALTMPALLISGDATTLAARSVAEVLQPQLADLRWIVQPGLGHMAPVTHPDLINPLFEDFLAEIAGRRQRQGV